MPKVRLLALLFALLPVGACSSRAPATDAGTTPPEEDAAVEAEAPDAGDSGLDKSAACASTFGSALTDAFGRVDGTILAVVPPTNGTCAQPNSTHLVLQVTMQGAAYRMVLNVFGAGADPRVFLAEMDAPLAGGAWAEGWHPGFTLDYVGTLGASSTAFAPLDQAALVDTVTERLVLGAHVAVFATSSGGSFASSAHLIHRNAPDADGAIVIDPETKPHYLLFRFPNQSF